MKSSYLVFSVVAILLVVYLVLACTGTGKYDDQENFTWANAVESLPGNYSVQGGNDCGGYDNGSNFADLVAPVESNQNGLPLPTRPFDNVQSEDLLPVDPNSVTSFDRDVTDPSVYLFRPSIRAQLKNRQQEGADPFRGDIPIVPCRKGWFDSRYGEGDSKLDAYFSDFTNLKYQALTGQRNIPSFTAAEETIMDYQDPIISA